MERIITSIETLGCGECGYYQNQDPFVPGIMAKLFPEMPGTSAGACPACYSGQNPDKTRRNCQLSRLVDLSQLSKVTVGSDDDLQENLKPDLDSNGNQLMVKTGEREALAIVDGKPAVVTEDIMEPKQRELTRKELIALKTQRDANLSELEKIAV